MHRFPSDFTFNSQSTPLTSVASSPAPAIQPPTDDAIEAVILQATSARQAAEVRPLRDTRTQLFIGNLPYRVRWQDLKDLFRKAGTVLRADVSLGPDNRSRGFGTVLLATAEDAGRAVDMFNGYSWQSRVLEVRLDRLLPEYESQAVTTGSSPASTGSSSYPLASTSSHQGLSSSFSEEHEYLSTYQSPDPASCRNLFVGNLPFHCQWQDLKDLFRQAGTILRADVALGPDGRSRGFGTVVFATDYDAEKAVRMFNGYEYNNRILKVNYDKFSQANQPLSTSEPPITANQQGQSYGNSMQIKLPPGFMLDYVPPSGPTSPYEMFSQLQQQHQLQQRQQQHRQQPQMLHQPQAQHYLQQHPLQQQRMQPPSHAYNLQPSLDIESLTNTLASSHLSKTSQTSQRAASSHKPSPISTAASSSHTSSSSEHSMASTSASSVSQSPSPAQARQQAQSQQHQSLQHQHPHHPGPITLPPLRPPIFPLSPHTPQASAGMSTSPLHHPSMGSPYQMYSTSAPSAHIAVYHQQYQHQQQQQQQHPQIVPLTPHGLPPITPSMPPFTFLPPSFNPGHHQPAQAPAQRQHQHQQTHVLSSSKDSSTSGSSAANPAASSSSSSSSSSSDSANINNPRQQQQYHHHHHQQLQQQSMQQYPSYATPNQHFIIPLPSPGLYMAAAQQPQPSPPAHLRLNLAGIPGAFSPGVVMSPGTFYGRPGEVPNPNPFINAAVGAPVHVHSPGGAGVGGHAGGAGSPGHGAMVPMYGQGHPHVTHGAYFYAMSSPKKGPPSGMEPKGYFDPMYFPAGGVGVGVGGSGLANEVMRDQDSGNSSSSAAAERKDQAVVESEEFSSPPGEASVSASVSASASTRTEASAASSGSSLTSWNTGDMASSAGDAASVDADKSGHHKEGHRSNSGDEGTAGSDETVGVSAMLDQGSTISRTHSVGYKKKEKETSSAEGPGTMSRGNSDPVHGSLASGVVNFTRAEGAAPPLNLRLPERVPWSRKQDMMVHTPTARTVSAAEYVEVGGEGEGEGEQPSASSTSLPSSSTAASASQ
ncbi:hypothetical protein CVT25_013783 [Psilocybe cyanescens]|uniref:RRM domain-containing protein n=1 Tax=Psilocybe cyanescens TaxID=93625 RepID=A0A409WTT4_PSICY|nr:hypothetical protein CVT25_013783 [Psilocybe cyanescens]